MKNAEKQPIPDLWQAILGQIGTQYALTGPFTMISESCAVLEVQSRLRFNSLHAVDNMEGKIVFQDGAGKTWTCEVEWFRWHSDNVVELIETRLNEHV